MRTHGHARSTHTPGSYAGGPFPEDLRANFFRRRGGRTVARDAATASSVADRMEPSAGGGAALRRFGLGLPSALWPFAAGDEDVAGGVVDAEAAEAPRPAFLLVVESLSERRFGPDGGEGGGGSSFDLPKP